MGYENVGIYVPVHNREKLAVICVSQLNEVKQGAKVHLTDDCSDKEHPAIKIADYYERLDKNLGIDEVRFRHLCQFLASDFEYGYFADSDVVHDPGFLDRAMYMWDNTNCLSSLYHTNTGYHKDGESIVLEMKDILLRHTIPGCSMFFDKELAKRMYCYIRDAKAVWGESAMAKWGQWDWAFCSSVPACAMSTRSYCDHFSIAGMHSHTDDRALAPTPYLRAKRKEVLNALV